MMKGFLLHAIEIQKEWNNYYKQGNMTMAHVQEVKLADLFKVAKASGVDINELNNQLVNHTIGGLVQK